MKKKILVVLWVLTLCAASVLTGGGTSPAFASYTLTTTVSGPKGPDGTAPGVISSSAASPVEPGTEVQFSVHANDGFYISKILVNGVLLENETFPSASDDITFFRAINANTKVIAKFAADPFVAVSVNNSTIGLIDPFPATRKVSVPYGDPQQFKIEQRAFGIHRDSVKLNGVMMTPDQHDNLLIPSVVKNSKLVAKYVANKYSITPVVSGAGKISPAKLTWYKHGKTVPVVVTPAKGYRVTSVTIDGEEQTLPSAPPYKFPVVFNQDWEDGRNVTVTATFNGDSEVKPVADAGDDVSALPGTVTLDGTGTDANGLTLTYQWQILSKPEGSTATLSNATTLTPSFTADRLGDYRFRLVITDGLKNSAADDVVVTIYNTAPQAAIGFDPPSPPVASQVTLSGSQSTDADGHELTYQWALVAKPQGSSATIAAPTSASSSFTPDKAGTYTVTLTVDDGKGGSDTEEVAITAVNTAPSASFTASTTTPVVGTTATFTSTSTDANGDALTYVWSLESAPAGSTSTMSGAATSQASLAPSHAGVYRIKLTVSDPAGLTGTYTMDVTAAGGTISLSPSSMQLPAANSYTAALTISNVGQAELNWSAALQQTGSWLSVSKSSGTVAAGGSEVISVFASRTGLADGTYDGTVSISDPKSSNSPQTLSVRLTVATAAAQSAKMNLSGIASIFEGSGGSSSSASLRRAAAGAAAVSTKLAGVKVVAVLLKPDGTKTEQFVYTDDSGAYSMEVNAKEGDTLTVNMEKDGFTTYSKSFTVSADGKLIVNGSMAQAVVVTATRSQGVFTTAAGRSVAGFKFGLVRNAAGRTSAFRSSDEFRAAKAEGGSSPDLTITIPENRVDSGVNALTAQLYSYDPSIPEDKRMFPGEFKGVGGLTAAGAAGKAADAGEYELESVVFLQSKITQSDGNEFAPVGAQVQASADDPPITIVKYIPQNGCEAIKKYSDRQADVAGIQVPIYTYNGYSGKWGYVGEGTIKQYDTEWNLQTVNTSDTAELSCSNQQYYVDIVVSDTWSNYWNLDYPLLFSQPEIACITGKVADGAGAGIAGTYVYGNGDTYVYAYTDESGNYYAETAISSGVDLKQYEFYVYNPMTYNYETFQLGDKNAEGCYTTNITLVDPWQGKISGKVVNNDAGSTPVAYASIYAYAESANYWYWAVTGEDGSYSLKVPQNTEVTISVRNLTLKGNANKTTGTDEASDDGKAVVMKNAVVENQPPEVWLSWWPEVPVTGSVVDFYAWAWDPEGEWPLTWKWFVDGVEQTTWTDPWYFTWTATAGAHTIAYQAADPSGKSATQTATFTVADAVNHEPVITYATYWRTSATDTSCSLSVTLYGYAYDQDGDTLTYTWKDGNGSVIGTGSEFAWPSAATGTVILEVSDGKGGVATQEVYVEAVNSPPYFVNAYPSNYDPAIGAEVILTADAYDPEGRNVTYSWTVTPETGTPAAVSAGTDGIVRWYPPGAGWFLAEVTATDACGQSATWSFWVYAADRPTSGTEIIFQ